MHFHILLHLFPFTITAGLEKCDKKKKKKNQSPEGLEPPSYAPKA